MELAGDEHGSNTKQLELEDGYESLGEIAINEVHSELDGLWNQLKFHLDDEKPVNQDFSVIWGQLSLPLKVAT